MNQGPQSKNYLAYDFSGNPYDKYEGYSVTNFERSDKVLSQPSNVLEPLEIPDHQPQTQRKKGFQVLNVAPEESVKQTSNYYQCPVCLELAVSSCDCEYRDCKCSSGHSWYRVSGVKTLGVSPNHKN